MSQHNLRTVVAFEFLRVVTKRRFWVASLAVPLAVALLFTVALVVIMFAGSVWVMYHMNTNMMPTPDPAAMRNMP